MGGAPIDGQRAANRTAKPPSTLPAQPLEISMDGASTMSLRSFVEQIAPLHD